MEGRRGEGRVREVEKRINVSEEEKK